MNSVLTVTRDDTLGPDALAMIGESEAEQSAIYPPEVRYAFSPEQLRQTGVRFFVCNLGEETIGCGGLACLDGYGEMKRIFVTKGHRGSGAARLIVETLEAEAKSVGLSVMRLETGLASPEALRFYDKMGYIRRGPFGDYVENGSSVFMEKNL